jgi:predicted RNA methylase
MKRIWCDAHHAWEVTLAKKEFPILSESSPFVVDLVAGDPLCVRRYWARRHDFWPCFSAGIVTDVEGLFSVTPWDAACAIAARLGAAFPGDSPIIVDVCCGVGGNTTAFAKCIAAAQVIGVDTSQARIRCAAANARVLGPLANVQFVHDDAIRFLAGLRNSARFVFASPPWGGPGYALRALEDVPFDLGALAAAACGACVGGVGRLALLLPKDFPPSEARRLAKGKAATMARFDVASGGRPMAACFVFTGLCPKKKEAPVFLYPQAEAR